MVSWYYVLGSERVGPVSEEILVGLYQHNEINQETYVWKKGFQNWERLKDVPELASIKNKSTAIEAQEEKTPTPIMRPQEKIQEKVAPKVVNDSPELKFNFNWSNIKENEELFFLKIGRDRKNFESLDLYGPYSLVELKEALKDKRINQDTLIFAPGMSSWMRLQDTPVFEGHKGEHSSAVMLNEIPLLFVIENSPIPLIAMVKKAGTKECSLLGAGPYVERQGNTVKASLYVGNEIKAKNIQMKIEKYHLKDQIIDCEVLDMDHEAKKIMLNHVS